jgi:hypothetical protein
MRRKLSSVEAGNDAGLDLGRLPAPGSKGPAMRPYTFFDSSYQRPGHVSVGEVIEDLAVKAL